MQGVWDFSFQHGTFEVAFLAKKVPLGGGKLYFCCKDYLRKSSWTLHKGTVVIDWGNLGSYTLVVSADGKQMQGSVTNNAASWRQAVFKRALSEAEVEAMASAVDDYVPAPHVHGPGCGHHHSDDDEKEPHDHHSDDDEKKPHEDDHSKSRKRAHSGADADEAASKKRKEKTKKQKKGKGDEAASEKKKTQKKGEDGAAVDQKTKHKHTKKKGD